MATHLASLHHGSVTVNLASAGLMAFSLGRQNPLLPRQCWTAKLHQFVLCSAIQKYQDNLVMQWELSISASSLPPDRCCRLHPVVFFIQARHRRCRLRSPLPLSKLTVVVVLIEEFKVFFSSKEKKVILEMRLMKCGWSGLNTSNHLSNRSASSLPPDRCCRLHPVVFFIQARHHRCRLRSPLPLSKLTVVVVLIEEFKVFQFKGKESYTRDEIDEVWLEWIEYIKPFVK
ncbi:hypothetical protein Ddye_026053 [Dipteronia dyeriana]|uniref:Uncharacterized protein n=1 Tax=Dipteronia dyeriana TaxID=168575 RepID=A0AAD9TM97_9ROSI|nr:hypothetical protein Ddye_026053 [Dipteronia dyeriana]